GAERLDDGGRSPSAVRGDGARHFSYGAAVARHGFKQLDDACLALALEHTIDRALAMLQNGLRGEGGAVATNADEGAWQTTFGSLRRIDDLGHIGDAVAGEGDEIRLPFCKHAVVAGVALALQVEKPHGVLGAAGSLRHEFEAQWFKPKENVRVEQRSRMNEQNLHGNPGGPTKSVEATTGLSRSAICWSRPPLVGFCSDSTESPKAKRPCVSALPRITTAR